MAEHEIDLELSVEITTTEEGEAAIERYVGLDDEEARRWSTTPNLTKEQVLGILAKAMVLYGRDDPSTIDGWADLDRGAITMSIDSMWAEGD